MSHGSAVVLSEEVVAKNWLGAIGGPGLVGAVIGWGITALPSSFIRSVLSAEAF